MTAPPPRPCWCAAEDDGGRRASAQATVPAHAEAEVPLVLPPAPAGDHWARVWIDGAAVPALAEGFLAYTCALARQVAFYGERADFALLPLAISPDGDGSLSGLVARVHDPAELASGPPAQAALVVMTWQGAQALEPSATAALLAWVRHGGRLLLVPAAAIAPDQAQPPSWAEASAQAIAPAAAGAGEAMIALDARADCFRDLVDAQGSVRFPSVRLRAGLALEGSAWHGLLGLDDGRAVMSARALGDGELVLCGFAFAPRWSTLPLSPACLPLAQAFALAGGDATGAARMVAGSRVRLGAPPGSAVRVVAIAGAAEDWQGTVAADGTVPGFPRAGVYLVRAAGGASAAGAAGATGAEADGARALISVRADRGEAAAATTEGEIPALAGVASDQVVARSREALTRAWSARRGGQDLMPALVIAAILALFAEGLIANRPLLRARPAGAPT